MSSKAKTTKNGSSSIPNNNKNKNGSSSSSSRQPQQQQPSQEAPSMTMALVLYWIVPIVVLGLLSRFSITSSDFDVSHPERKIAVDWNKNALQQQQQRIQQQQRTTTPSSSPTSLSTTTTTTQQEQLKKHSSSYQEVVNTINKRRRRKKFRMSTSTTTRTSDEQQPKTQQKQQKQPRSTSSTSDPNRIRMDDMIQQARQTHQSDPSNVFKAIVLADALRQRDLTFHDGGYHQGEALEKYQHAIDLTLERRHQMLERGESTTQTTTTTIQDELFLPHEQKSVDGLLVSLYTNKGKMYFMANMFEKAVECYQKALELEPLYLDALGGMGSSLIILGRYDEAGKAFSTSLKQDTSHIFMDIFTGLTKVLVAKEDAVEGGWEPMVAVLEEWIPKVEGRIVDNMQQQSLEQKQMLVDGLKRMHHAMFYYHDVKTNDTTQAWYHLSTGYQHKMSMLSTWNRAFENQKVSTTMQIFKRGFWPASVGSTSRTPIFIIGFVRSGSTLLERVLDAHPYIVGTGEDSVFNGRLDGIRNGIVEASLTGSTETIQNVVERMANEVVDDMRKRWELIEEANSEQRDEEDSDSSSIAQRPDPQRFADKMLTNYMNVGFIHMLFPKALILHVAREPMDTIFSAYKHEFPPGTLDYTSDFSSLADLYHNYRRVMQHWDDVLPGRITHVRYEDMVHDMPGMAKAIIDATGLPWDEDVLNFHKKKHAVNTLSTSQVRKGVYKDSLKAWKRYEEQLQPLVELVGDEVDWDLKTTLPSYVSPTREEE